MKISPNRFSLKGQIMLKKLLKLIFQPSYGFSVVMRVLYTRLLQMKRNVEVQGKITVLGKPLVDIREGCRLIIGPNVTLNSQNKNYHINMFAPVKLFVDKAGGRITIGENSRIHGSCLHAYKSINVGKNCLIAANCQIFDSSGHDLSFLNTANRIHTTSEGDPIVIEDDVWICANSTILPGVTIGKGSVIAANSVVSKDIPPMCVAGGNPARVIKDMSGV